MQEMVPAVPAGERPGPSTGRRDVRKAAEKEAPAIYAEVLERYCFPSVTCQYKSLPKEAQENVLKALRVTVEEGAQRITLESTLQKRSGRKASGLVKSKDTADAACPLFRALKLVSEVDYTKEDIDAVKELLVTWGQKLPREILVMRHLAGYNRMKKENQSTNAFRTLSTNSTLAKPEQGTGHGPRAWDALQPIGMSSLPLFEVARRRVLIGKLVVPPMVTVGITTVLEDSSGAVMQLGLYNQLPGGVTGSKAQELAEKIFPEGACLRIAEPYLKIFRDGHQGVRVDSPHDIRVEGTEAQLDLSDCRLEGNKLFGARQFDAALSLYWQGLQSCGDLATLLSNRAQAQLKQEKWCDALRDSAASLLLCPSGTKHRARYVAALQGLGFSAIAQRARDISSEEALSLPLVHDTRKVLQIALKSQMTKSQHVLSKDHSTLKEKGNAAFREGQYPEALVSN